MTNSEVQHEKTDHEVATKINSILSPKLSEEAQHLLHEQDIDTTWFGVVREDHEYPLFRDYGRYATLIAGVKDLRLPDPTSLSAPHDEQEVLYPGLVSFVGQTGAGKSTLIKLLIDLSTRDDEKESFPTPIVGAAGKDIATSEDVHLYLDPATFESQVPLLFADCEGLEGGAREPVATKIRKTMDRSRNAQGASKARLKHISERQLEWAPVEAPVKRQRDFVVAHLYPRLLYTFSDVVVFVLKNPR